MKDIDEKATYEIFLKNLNDLKKEKLDELDEPELIQLICAGCPFFDPEKERLECGAYRILKKMLKSGKISKSELFSLFK